ncbi:nitroreductase [Sphingorhabdus pulchriflava]|uniref:Putative NAD(P)H nitroreductase n=1 Tax=Sphingorhabdus pulchriflava TaxID=2292257 RepID=A0A371BHD6_9SPHN|nr:nitroreductase [Sphingorhabdus pulchriflava]RDV07009.1 nitroreductase [Sphingorhabdus pulchriflava]
MLNDLSSLPTYLASRRSGKPRDMIVPGPDAAQLGVILQIAIRTPDHGKLFPWRFVVIEDRDAFAALLHKAFVSANPEARPAQIEAAIAPAHFAPTLVLLLYAPQESPKIPLWEQQLSVGAVGMNLLHAAHAHGFVASWITGWTSYDPTVRDVICEGEEQIAGLFYIGTASQPLEERPRPEPQNIIRHWP